MAVTKNGVPTVVTLIPKEQQTEETLLTMYSERIGEVNEHVNQRLKEYFMFVRNARREQEDWFFWCHKAIMDVATKTTTEQRTLGYLLGVFKAWLTYGFGTFLNAELLKVRGLFINRFNLEPSEECMHRLSLLVNNYGLVHAVSSILLSESQAEDPSLVAVQQCEAYADVTYPKIGGAQ